MSLDHTSFLLEDALNNSLLARKLPRQALAQNVRQKFLLAALHQDQSLSFSPRLSLSLGAPQPRRAIHDQQLPHRLSVRLGRAVADDTHCLEQGSHK